MSGDDFETAEIDVRRAGPTEIDLRDRLRSAAGSLSAEFGEILTTDHAEALVFSSAEGLLASASVTEFVPILAERRARLALRSGATAPAVIPASRPTAPAEAATAASAAPVPVAPLLAVPAEDLGRLRAGIEGLRERVTGWQAGLRHG